MRVVLNPETAVYWRLEDGELGWEVKSTRKLAFAKSS